MPADHGDRQPEHHLDQRHAGVVHQQPPVVAQRVEGLDRRGERQVVHRVERGDALPGEHEQADQPQGERDASSPERLQRARLDLGEGRAGDRARSRQVDREVGDHPPRAAARAPRSGRRGRPPPRRRGSRAATVRGSAASAAASHSRRSARVIASSAPNGSSSSSTGRPGSSVRRKATRWRIPPDSAAGRARSNSVRPKRSNSGSARSARLARAARPGTRARAPRWRARRARAAAGRAGACTRTPRGGRRRRWRRARRRRPRRAPAAQPTSSSRVDLPHPEGPTTAVTAWALQLEVDARERRQRPVAPGDLPKRKRLRHGSLCLCPHRSLRGHYPTGSKGQRRAMSVVEGAISARCPRAPLALSRRSVAACKQSPGAGHTPPEDE